MNQAHNMTKADWILWARKTLKTHKGPYQYIPGLTWTTISEDDYKLRIRNEIDRQLKSQSDELI